MTRGRLGPILMGFGVAVGAYALTRPKTHQNQNGAPSPPVNGWWWPVVPCKTTSSRFGQRPNPFPEETSAPVLECHRGLDIPCREGAAVVATRAGTVLRASLAGSAGNLIEIRHDDGSKSRYMHLSSFAVRAGDVVTGGQVIGAVGTTGRSTGPHLHFEIRTPQGVALDPGPFFGLPAGVPC